MHCSKRACTVTVVAFCKFEYYKYSVREFSKVCLFFLKKKGLDARPLALMKQISIFFLLIYIMQLYFYLNRSNFIDIIIFWLDAQGCVPS